MQPAQLLQDFGMIWVTLKYLSICKLGVVVLGPVRVASKRQTQVSTYILLLLMNVTNLKPNIFLSQRRGWKGHDVAETLPRVNLNFHGLGVE